MTNDEIGSVSRRTFVQTTAAATAAMMFNGGASVAGSDVIRVGVVGCGGRGTGAAMDVMRSSDGVEIVALGDLLPDRLAECRANLAKETAGNAALASKYKVTNERCFTGFDAYQKVLALTFTSMGVADDDVAASFDEGPRHAERDHRLERLLDDVTLGNPA